VGGRFDPYKDVEEEQRKLVLGGQTSLWAEQVGFCPTNIAVEGKIY
jgi:hypothetical protein